ncbi:hypothetical protein LAC79_33295 [Ensifer adhaerens]|uniref:hypothetical protein n=1 Tax=Ensifer adhaerens TaxID=106592 RepID=UPI001CBEB008|nr:hypothetical protein [Ensifer adhaerens]MBZ7926652.1 hypothetical protein [Ensifer adhaerens]UAX97018.1 hypothetical protein LAC78_25040 [Ensifer adhaerens]
MPEEHPVDSRPHFVIPYWPASGPGTPADDGNVRPLPGNVVSYLCSSIKTSPYKPGETLDVTVEVHNYGGGNAPQQAQVTVWWADPATGFVLAPDRLIGFQMFAVPPRGGTAVSSKMTKEIPAAAPPHICLLARVSHQFDRPGNVADPVNDRHWAQRNLAVVPAQPGVPLQLVFIAGNPFERDATFVLLARPVTEHALRAIADELRAEPREFDGEIGLAPAGRDVERGNTSLTVDLAAGAQQRLQVLVSFEGELARDQFTGVEVLQLHEDGERLVGGIGFVLSGNR